MSTSTLPAFSKDVTGQTYGGAFWDSTEFRIKIRTLIGDHERFLMTVETSEGTEVNQTFITLAEADGIDRMATTDHGLSGYEDDWAIPMGMRRTLSWDLPVDEGHLVTLEQDAIDEIAAWLRYATGEETYDGDTENWEY